MDLSQIPLFAMLRGRMGYLSERQQVIAQNVANSDTPGYLPRDLKAFSFDARVEALCQARDASTGPVQTQPGHMGLREGRTATRKYKTDKGRDSETTLDGNAVVLEEQMMKMSDARMNYDAAIGFYQKSLGLIRMASRAPGK
jgi:flagellar basal-body rod protein FlgB